MPQRQNSRMNINCVAVVLVSLIFQTAGAFASSPSQPIKAPEGWQTTSPREEIRPAFSFEPGAGHSGRGAFVIQHDAREGLDGSWTKTFPVQGGHFYRFEVFRKTDAVDSPRRSAMVRLLWRDVKGGKVLRDEAPSAK